jgi:hypothetical protein
MTYTSVQRDKFQKAFAIAHHASESYDLLNPAEARAKFKEIARLLWDAHGEIPKGNPPKGAGGKLLGQAAMAETARKL